jgi:hypothetical protein
MVAKIAIAIPAAAIRLPFLALAGLDNIFNPSMKDIDPIK